VQDDRAEAGKRLDLKAAVPTGDFNEHQSQMGSLGVQAQYLAVAIGTSVVDEKQVIFPGENR
jgi:hypothetical protein